MVSVSNLLYRGFRLIISRDTDITDIGVVARFYILKLAYLPVGTIFLVRIVNHTASSSWYFVTALHQRQNFPEAHLDPSWSDPDDIYFHSR